MRPVVSETISSVLLAAQAIGQNIRIRKGRIYQLPLFTYNDNVIKSIEMYSYTKTSNILFTYNDTVIKSFGIYSAFFQLPFALFPNAMLSFQTYDGPIAHSFCQMF